MQWLAEICVRRPIFALMLIAALVVAGGASYLQLGIDRFPKMDLPTIFVSVNYPGASPEEAESEVTQLLEDAVATVAGIDELRSISREGQALLLLTFTLDRPLDAALQDVRDAIGSVVNRLPVGVDPPVVRKRDTDSSPILTLAVAGPYEARELYLYAERGVKNVLESAKGVGEVSISGAAERAMQVNLRAERLAAYQLSILQVREALLRQNIEVPGGRVDSGHEELGLRTLGRFDSAEQFAELVVATVDGVSIRIRDLGEVDDATKEVRSLARLDGRPAVVLQVQRQSDANTVAVIDAVKDRLARSRELLPDDVQVEIISDQSRYIKAAMHEVEGHLVVGSILASIVVLLFMRSWRSTVIAAVAIPASVIATFAMMRALDFTLNNVTMLALVLMVGVVIDDAIVVLENVFRMIEEKGLDPRTAAVVGTKEIGLAVLATTLSLVIVFLPVSFLSSVTGRMLYQFGLTATVATLVSLLVSFSLTPMMCSRMLRPNDKLDLGPASRRGPYAWLEAAYLWLLGRSLQFRWLVVLVALGVIYSNWPLYQYTPQDYIPTNVDEGEFEVRVTLPEGASMRVVDEAMRDIEAAVLATRGVEHALCTVGSSTGSSSTRVNYAQLYVRIGDIKPRTFSLERLAWSTLRGDPAAAWRGNFSQQDVMRNLRSRLKEFPDLQVSVRNQTSLRQGAPVDIDFSITGPNLDELIDYSARLEERARRIPGIVDVARTLTIDKPQLLVHIDRSRAAALGVDIREIAETLRVAVGGDDRASRFRDETVDDAFDVELRLVADDRDTPEAIGQLYVRTRPGAADPLVGSSATTGADFSGRAASLTRLDNLAAFQVLYTAPRIDRLDRQRMVAVRANIETGYALSDRLDALHAAAREVGLPPGCQVQVLGRGRELERTLADFGWTFVLSFIFMYIVLAAQFEHLVHPLTILISLPLATPFGLLALYWGGETLNLYSALGILVLFGVVKKAAILQVDHTNQLRERGLERHDAIMQANRDRLRPILMTTISFVAGMLPLLIAVGPGAEERRSIAVLAVGGQTLSLVLTLIAVPVFYTVFDDIGRLVARFRRKPPSYSPAAAADSRQPNSATTG